MEMENNMVQIATAEYKDLLKAKFDLEMVKDVLINRASTGWSGKYLAWSDETTSTIFKHILGDAYDKKLEELNKLDEPNSKEVC
jgi:hypothetical protein